MFSILHKGVMIKALLLLQHCNLVYIERIKEKMRIKKNRKLAYIYLFEVLIQDIRGLSLTLNVDNTEAIALLEEINSLAYTFHNLPDFLGDRIDEFDEQWFWNFINKRHAERAGFYRKIFEWHLGKYKLEEFVAIEDWRTVDSKTSTKLILEINKELNQNHVIYNSILNVVAKKENCDTVLFEVFKDDKLFYAEVHLSWKSKTENDSECPICNIYNSLKEWKINKMNISRESPN